MTSERECKVCNRRINRQQNKNSCVRTQETIDTQEEPKGILNGKRMAAQ